MEENQGVTSAALIRLSAKSGYYEGVSEYINEAQNDVVEGWFQFPMHVQIISTLLLMFFGVEWWLAMLVAWVPSGLTALAVRWSASRSIGTIGHKFRYLSPLVAAIGIIYGMFQPGWSLVVMSTLSLVALPGMLCPAFILMSIGSKEHPKYTYASLAFGIRFPHQAAAEQLENWKPQKDGLEETVKRVLADVDEKQNH